MCGALARAGHEVTLVTYGGGEGPWPAGLTPDDVRWIPGLRIPGPERSGPHPLKPLLDADLAWRVARIARSVDVVHAHNVEAPFVAWLAQALSFHRVPVVYSVHTSLEEELPTYGGHAGRRAKLGRWVDRALARGCSASAALSERAAELLRGHGARRVVVTPPGVNLGELQGSEHRARARVGEGPWVVYTGNLDAYQDLDLLLEAMRSVPAKLLVVSGSSLDDWPLRERFEQLPGAVFWSSTAFQDTLDAIALADVMAIPRRVCAGFPMKALNALGMATPVVVSDGVALDLPGCMTGGSTAAHFADALSDALTRDLHSLGEAARTAVAADWTWDVRAKELTSLYRDLVMAR